MGKILVDYEALIGEIVGEVAGVDGVAAVVLGGSRAKGTHTEASDIDLGIYYDPAKPLDLVALNQVATRLDDSHGERLLTPVGGWGPWINGGGWLHIQGAAVDFIYRDLVRVTELAEQCLAGQVQIVYQPGHPFGFLSSIYFSEIALCKTLWEADDRLSVLKALTQPYPPALKKALIEKFSWEIQFALENAKKAISRQDTAYVAGCAFRAVMCMAQVLFAVNEEYWMNEKGAVAFAESFRLRPVDWQGRVNVALQALAPDTAELAASIQRLNELAHEVAELAGRG